MDDEARFGIGGNIPPLGQQIAATEGDFASVTTAFLEDAYASQPKVVAALLEEARALPAAVDDDEIKGKYVSLIKRMRDQRKALAALHAKEKGPYLRGGQAVDQFFFGLIDRLERRDRKAKPGGADVLLSRVDDYDQRILAEERARRQREADEAARLAREEIERAAKAAREAEEARRAAERARKPETVEERRDEALLKADAAQAAATEAAIAQGKADEARIESFARPAEIMRRRGDDGTLSTMQTEAYAEIEDETLLDKERLWPFVPFEAKERALRAWAKSTGHMRQMPGAKIGRRPKSVVR